MIGTKAVAKQYRRLMKALDVQISDVKSMASENGSMEFASRFILRADNEVEDFCEEPRCLFVNNTNPLATFAFVIPSLAHSDSFVLIETIFLPTDTTTAPPSMAVRAQFEGSNEYALSFCLLRAERAN